jgi:hypothetical protein
MPDSVSTLGLPAFAMRMGSTPLTECPDPVADIFLQLVGKPAARVAADARRFMIVDLKIGRATSARLSSATKLR